GVEGAPFRARLAVQIPKVITSPKPNPIMMAIKTSFLTQTE
ncbi:MAG: hypothetical protein LiPW31_183, partial [Microgenomates group bacterium LiPW_31]